MSDDPLEDALMQVALGDEGAIKQVTAHLRSLEDGLAQSQGPSAVQQEIAQLQGQRKFLKTVLAWARENPDVAYDDEAYARAVQVDSNLARAYPELDESRRLAAAADIVREELGSPETRDYSAAIRTMRARRQGTEVEEAPSRGDATTLDERIERDIDLDRSSTIAAMKLAREALRSGTEKAYTGPLKDPANPRR